MRPFYRMLTHTVLALQFVIIIYLLCPHHKNVPVHSESCKSKYTDSVIPASGFCNAAKAEWKNAEWKDLHVLWK
jgi:hypothetical protein